MEMSICVAHFNACIFNQNGNADELIAEIKLAQQKSEEGLGFWVEKRKAMIFLYETFIMLG